LGKCLSAWGPSSFGVAVCGDVVSMVRVVLFWPEGLGLRNVSGAWLLSLVCEGGGFAVGVMALPGWLGVGSVGRLRAGAVGRPGLLAL